MWPAEHPTIMGMALSHRRVGHLYVNRLSSTLIGPVWWCNSWCLAWALLWQQTSGVLPMVTACCLIYYHLWLLKWSRDSIVSIATRYGLNDPVIESRWGRDFLHLSRPALRPTTMGTGSFLRVKQLGRGIDHPFPSSAEIKERVEINLCSPSGPSWPVLGELYLYLLWLLKSKVLTLTPKNILLPDNYWQAPFFILCVRPDS